MTPKRLKMVGYAGSVIRSPWWGRLVFDVAGMTYKARLPVLREHNREKAVGVLDKITREPGRLTAQGFFLDSPDGRTVQDLLKQGFPLQASVGIEIMKVEKLGKEESAQVNGSNFQGPGFVVRSAIVHEISAVTLGADSETSVAYLAASLGSAPKAFEDAVLLKLEEGLPVEAAIQAAARDYPALHQAYKKQFSPAPDPDSADAVLARKAELLAAQAGIPLNEAVERVFAGSALHQAFKRQFSPAPDPDSADAVLARKAELLAAQEGIPLNEAVERVFADPDNQDFVKDWQRSVL